VNRQRIRLGDVGLVKLADCVRRHLLDDSPMMRIERAGRPKSRERVLTDPELKSVWLASQDLRSFFRGVLSKASPARPRFRR
jgi:hypothetical protein